MAPRMTHFSWAIRRFLLHFRTHRLSGPVTAKPSSAEYLYLVQQSKRISLATTVGRFSRWNILLWPYLTLLVLMKWIDLSIATTIIRSFINESVLQRLSAEGHGAADWRTEDERGASASRTASNHKE